MSNKAAEQLFTSMLKEAGMPTTEEAIRAEWGKCVEEEGVLIKNSSSYSPFWRLISAIVTKPVLWIVTLLIQHALPNTFLLYASGVWLDVYAWGLNLARKDAVKAQGELLFTRASASGGLTIPAGTIIESPSLNGKIYRVITTQDSVISDGALGARAQAEAEAEGEAWNLGPGYYSILPKPVQGIVSVANPDDWLITPGADTENDDNFRMRCRNQFAAVGQYHHDAAYKALIVEHVNVPMDYIFFEKDAPRGPGTANGYIMLENGPAPQAFVDEINQFIMESGNHGHGDDLQCFPMPELPQNIEVMAYPKLGLSEAGRAALKVEVENRIRCVFRQNQDYDGLTKTLPLSRFSFSKLGDELHNALPDLRSVTFNVSDIVAYLQLPTLESLTVTVEDGL